MIEIKKISKYIVEILFDKQKRFGYFYSLGVYNNMSDEKYLKMRYYYTTGKILDLDNPVTFNEKIQWLKLYNRNPKYTIMVDKFEVKKYVAGIIGEEYVIPTLGVWDDFDDINYESLPNQFVLKCTHDSGSVVIVKDKNKFDKKEARRKFEISLKKNFFYHGREWSYKSVKPRIIGEKYMVDESGLELKDYKIFTFMGEPKLIQVDYGRFAEHKRNLYTTNWEYIDASIQYPTDKQHIIEKPKELEKMLELARILARDIPHVRVDFYYINGKIFFGEMTFYHGSGYEKFTPESLGIQMGEWIELQKI